MDATEEILAYLGLGKAAKSLIAPRAPPEQDEVYIGKRGGYELWRSRTETAEWIELRGPDSTLRATRPKAKLLLGLQPAIERWASGLSPGEPAADVTFRVKRRSDQLKLEVRYRGWKPIRLCRRQAAAFLAFEREVRQFTGAGRRGGV